MFIVDFILSLVLGIGLIRFVSLYIKFKSEKVLIFILAFLAYSIYSLYWITFLFDIPVNDKLFIENIIDWIRVVGVSCILCALAIENWEDRPAVSRFPHLLVYAPVLIIITYAFVYDTLYLKEVILGIYEAGSLLVALLLFGLLTIKNKDYINVFIAIIFITVAFIFSHLSFQFILSNEWIWKIILIASIYIFQTSYLFAANRVFRERLNE